MRLAIARLALRILRVDPLDLVSASLDDLVQDLRELTQDRDVARGRAAASELALRSILVNSSRRHRCRHCGRRTVEPHVLACPAGVAEQALVVVAGNPEARA